MLSVFAGGRLFGERHGDPPARVLALHGWGRSRADFASVLAGLPAVALDLPGFGSSPPPQTAWGSSDYAGLVAEAAEELAAGLATGTTGSSPASDAVTAHLAATGPAQSRPPGLLVLGHSFGGCVAVQLAAARPDLVASLVLCGVPRLVGDGAPAARPKLAYRSVRALHRARLVSDDRLEAARRRHGSPDYRNAEGILRDVLVRLLAENLEPEVRRLTCPVQLVWGENDSAAPLAAARRVAELVPGCELDVLAGVGHLVPLERPQALREAVEAGLARLACPA